MSDYDSPHYVKTDAERASAAGVLDCLVGIPPPGLISKQGHSKRGTSAISLQTPPSNEATINEPSHHDTHPSVKMARRPARCYRYCKNKVSDIHHENAAPGNFLGESKPSRKVCKRTNIIE